MGSETEEVALPQLEIVSRVGSLPIVMTAVGQLGAFYNYTKGSNSLVRFSLETAESGLKYTTAIAAPMIIKLEKPVSQLDAFAVSQLDRLEQRVPVLTKPTPQIVEEAGHLYNVTLKPTVEKITVATQYGVHSYNGVKDFSKSAVNEVKNYTTQSLDGVKHRVHHAATYSKTKVGEIAGQGKSASVQQVQVVTDYGKNTVTSLGTYGEEKLGQLMHTKYGVMLGQQMDWVLDTADSYVDYYLPGSVKQETVDENAKDVKPNLVRRASHLSRKVGGRVYARSMKRLETVALRSAEMVSKLNYTIDLIDYAKKHIDGGKKAVSDGLVKSKDKVWSVWEQVQLSEEQILQQQNNTQSKDLESRLIATARHLTLSIKHSFDRISINTYLLPVSLQNTFISTRSAANQVYQSFVSIKSLNDVKAGVLNNARNLTVGVQNLSVGTLAYIAALPATLISKNQPGSLIEMEEIKCPLEPKCAPENDTVKEPKKAVKEPPAHKEKKKPVKKAKVKATKQDADNKSNKDNAAAIAVAENQSTEL